MSIIGIDLGTTFSLAAILQDGKPVLIGNEIGEFLTPSAVSIDDDGTVLVGPAARARAVTHPERTAVAFKRDMGTNRIYDLGGQEKRPEELSALVLRALKRDAEAMLGEPVTEAVVTVPAYFGELQRRATRDAGTIAGLTIERIINEPTAAALAYGLHARDRELKAVVVDLGGGTFDVTVLEIIEGVVEIQSSAGDSRLGGEDFDDVLQRYVEDQYAARREHGLARDARTSARLREACELAKKRLSRERDTVIALTAVPHDDGEDRDIEMIITRDAVEAAWKPLLERIRTPIRRALRDAGLAPGEIDEVLLVGGATRMPCVAQLITEFFGRLPLRHLPPDEAVAHGAAVQAALKQGAAAVDDMVVTDVAPFSMGIESATQLGNHMVQGLFTPILERGTVIPASRVKSFYTMTDNQKEIVVKVYQGEHSSCVDNTFLGKYTITGLPRGRAGEQGIDVRFTYDLNGILEVETTILATRRVEHLVIQDRPGAMNAKDVARALEAMEQLKFHPRDALPNNTALARADALYTQLIGAQRDHLAQAIAVFQVALESQRPEEIEPARQQLIALTDSLAR